jgi:hypothetical protein
MPSNRLTSMFVYEVHTSRLGPAVQDGELQQLLVPQPAAGVPWSSCGPRCRYGQQMLQLACESNVQEAVSDVTPTCCMVTSAGQAGPATLHDGLTAWCNGCLLQWN